MQNPVFIYNVHLFKMLCLICVVEIFQDDELQCSICKEFLHFTCAGYKKANFRKLKKQQNASFYGPVLIVI